MKRKSSKCRKTVKKHHRVPHRKSYLTMIKQLRSMDELSKQLYLIK